MKIEEFRLACYNLFGYKMQVSGAKYTLSSMYADREEDVLCFGRNESGGKLADLFRSTHFMR